MNSLKDFMSELKTSGSDSSTHTQKLTTQSHSSPSGSDIVDLTIDDSRNDVNIISDSDDSKSVISDSDDDTGIVSTTSSQGTGNKTLGMRFGFGTSFMQKQSFSKPSSPNPSVLLDKSKKLNIKTLGVHLPRPQPNILKPSQSGNIKENISPFTQRSGDLTISSKFSQGDIRKQTTSLSSTRPQGGVPVTSKSSIGGSTKQVVVARPSGGLPNVSKDPHNNAVKLSVPLSRPSTSNSSILKYTTPPLLTSGGGVPFVLKAIHGYGHSNNTLVPLKQPSAPKPTHSSIHIPLGKPMPIVVLQGEAAKGSADNSPLREKARLAENILSLKEKIRQIHKSLTTLNLDTLPDKGLKLQMQHANMKKELNNLHKQYKVLSEKIEASSSQENAQNKASSSSQNSFDKLPVAQPYKRPGTYVMAESLTGDSLVHLHSALRSCPLESGGSDPGPQGLTVPLLPHQEKAMAWLLWREEQHPKGGILADDMGLGKTLTMIALILRTKELRQDNQENLNTSSQGERMPRGGTLVVCPASVLRQWEAEIKNRCERKKLSVFVYHGKERTSDLKTLTRKDIVLTTYNLVGREGQPSKHTMSLDGLQPHPQGTLFEVRWERVILDEAHMVRNPKTVMAKGVYQLRSTYRWALTGTPIHNKLLDLYSLICFLKFTPFSNEQVWRRCAENKSAMGTERLNTIMKSIMLRRTKAELQAEGQLKCLPNKEVQTIEVVLDPEEDKIYQHLLQQSKTLMAKFLMQRAERQVETGENPFAVQEAMAELNNKGFNVKNRHQMDDGEKVQASHILLQLLRLRQICCHTALVKSKIDAEAVTNDGIENADEFMDLVANMSQLDLEDEPKSILHPNNPVFDDKRTSSKIAAVLDLVLKIQTTREKVVLVSQWTSMLDIMEWHLRHMGIRSTLFTGKLDAQKRQDILHSFNQENSGPRVLLLSLTAGGTGVNLIGGNHLVLMDIHWNPQLEAQAMDRVYRVGQKRDVKIYRLICGRTVEQSIQMIQEKKLQVAAGILNAKSKTKLDFEDLKSLFLSI